MPVCSYPHLPDLLYTELKYWRGLSLPAPQQVEGSVDLFKMSSGSFVLDQWDSHHLRTRLVVVEIIVSRETDRSPANDQEKALNFILSQC